MVPEDKPNVYQKQIQALEQKAEKCPFPEVMGELTSQIRSLKAKAREIELYPDRVVQLAREFYKQHDKLQEQLDRLMPEPKGPEVENREPAPIQETPKSRKSELLQFAQKALEDVKNNEKTPDQAIGDLRKNMDTLKERFKEDTTKTRSQKEAELAEFKVIVRTLQQLQQAAKVDQQGPDFSQLREQQRQLSQMADQQRQAMGRPSIHEERVLGERQQMMSITQGTLNGNDGPSTKPPPAPAADVKQEDPGPSTPKVEQPDPARDMLLSIQKDMKQKSEEYSSQRKESKGITGMMYNAGKGRKKDEMLKDLSERLSSISPKSDDLKGEILKAFDDIDNKYKNSPSQEVSNIMKEMRSKTNALPDPDVSQKHSIKAST